MLIYWEAVGPHRFKFNAIISFCETYFYKTNTESMRYKNLRDKHIEKLLRLTIFILLLMILCYCLAFGLPIYKSIFENNRVTPIGVNLPFFEKDSRTEFMINVPLQVTMACYSLSGSFIIEVASCTINHAIMLVPDLIRFNLLEFHDEFIANGITAKSMAQLRNTYIQLQDYNDYLTNVIEIYANKLFICPFSWAFSMSISIFAALVLQKIGGLGCAVACYAEMMIVCYMGNNVKKTVTIFCPNLNGFFVDFISVA